MFSKMLSYHSQRIETKTQNRRLKRTTRAILAVAATFTAALAGIAQPAEAACSKGQVVTGVKFLTPRASSDQTGEPRSFTLSPGPALVLAVGKGSDAKIELTIPTDGRFLCRTNENSYMDQNVTVCRALVRQSDMKPGQRDREFKVIVKNLSTENTLEYNLICVNEPGDIEAMLKAVKQ